MNYVSIHQPNFLPWIGLIHKIFISDSFIFLNDVKFSSTGFQNRNFINSKNKSILLTVPVKKDSNNINQKEIVYSVEWREKHLKSLYYSYQNSDSFLYIYNKIEQIYSQNYTYLSDLNINLILFVLEYLNCNTQLFFSDEFNIKAEKNQRIIELCQRIEADAYIYGSGSNYLDNRLFSDANIKLISQNFEHPVYSQVHQRKFESNLSIIDYLFSIDKDYIIQYFNNEREKFYETNKKLSAIFY